MAKKIQETHARAEKLDGLYDLNLRILSLLSYDSCRILDLLRVHESLGGTGRTGACCLRTELVLIEALLLCVLGHTQESSCSETAESDTH
jgi:hypothetical protein